MNIFVTDQSPILSAQALDDKRLSKMALEGFQMMATAIHELKLDPKLLPQTIDGKPYASTHKNHPCNVWIRESKHNAAWLVKHIEELMFQYGLAYGKRSSLYQNIFLMKEVVDLFPDKPMTPFAKAVLDEFKEVPDVFQAYRKTLVNKWNVTDKRSCTWNNRTKPSWAM